MKTFKLAIAGALALALGACNPITINLPGLPTLTLTGNLGNDMPSINQFNTALKAGAKSDLATLQGYFNTFCPYVPQAQADLPQAQSAAQSLGMTSSAAAKQVGNAATALTVAANVCATGTSTNWTAAFQNAVTAFDLIEGLVKNAKG